MEVKNITEAIERTYNYSKLKSLSGLGGVSLRVNHDPTNCKLSYIHGSGVLQHVKENDEKKLILDNLLSYCKGAVIINTTSKIVADFIAATYPVYYFQNVPIGYGTGFQYHICIKNTLKPNSACRNPKTQNNNSINIENIKNKLVTILKNKRRKDDYVDEFLKSL